MWKIWAKSDKNDEYVQLKIVMNFKSLSRFHYNAKKTVIVMYKYLCQNGKDPHHCYKRRNGRGWEVNDLKQKNITAQIVFCDGSYSSSLAEWRPVSGGDQGADRTTRTKGFWKSTRQIRFQMPRQLAASQTNLLSTIPHTVVLFETLCEAMHRRVHYVCVLQQGVLCIWLQKTNIIWLWVLSVVLCLIWL